MKIDKLRNTLRSGEAVNSNLEKVRRAVAESLTLNSEIVDLGEEILQLIVDVKRQLEEFTNIGIVISAAKTYDNMQGFDAKRDELLATLKNMMDAVNSFDATIRIPEAFVQGLKGINLDLENPE